MSRRGGIVRQISRYRPSPPSPSLFLASAPLVFAGRPRKGGSRPRSEKSRGEIVHLRVIAVPVRLSALLRSTLCARGIKYLELVRSFATWTEVSDSLFGKAERPYVAARMRLSRSVATSCRRERLLRDVRALHGTTSLSSDRTFDRRQDRGDATSLPIDCCCCCCCYITDDSRSGSIDERTEGGERGVGCVARVFFSRHDLLFRFLENGAAMGRSCYDHRPSRSGQGDRDSGG